MTIQTREDAIRFWQAYDAKLAELQLSDTAAESAFHVNPHRAHKWEREFWTNTYTPEVHAALKAFGQEYYD